MPQYVCRTTETSKLGFRDKNTFLGSKNGQKTDPIVVFKATQKLNNLVFEFENDFN